MPIVLAAPGTSNVLFGTQDSGSKTTTGWVGPNTGMLVVENGSKVSLLENFSQLAALAPVAAASSRQAIPFREH